jgi:coenzyme F420-dependent glucose-6-phosphate dehydrogenase
MLRVGYKASAEQFDPTQLLRYASVAEALGLGTIAISDHFQPWRHHTGHAPNALVWLGAVSQKTQNALLGTSVLTPTIRYHPSIIAQAFATLACLSPGRVFLGVGTGEAMNEIPATALEWPEPRERRQRLREAIELIRLLWSEERVDFDGAYYSVSRATIYDRPSEPVPIYVAASGPLAAKLCGRVGDGFICTSGKDPELYRTLLSAVAEGASSADRDASTIDRMIEIKVSYDEDLQHAREASYWWAALALTPEEKSGTDDPLVLERLADEHPERAERRFIISDDPAEVARRISFYTDLGFNHLVFHFPGSDQEHALEEFASDVLPLVRALEPAVVG